MKIPFFISFLLYSALVFSQGFPNNQSVSNASTLYHAKGGITGDVGFVNTRYPDTLATNITDPVIAANLIRIAGVPGAQIIVGDTVYMRNNTATKWIIIGSGSIVVNGDTTYVELPLYVDTLGGIRTLKIFHTDGYEGGVVTYAGTGFDFNVSPITLYLRNKVFLFPATTLTLSPPNSEPRYDIFGVDSLGAFVKSGDTSALPIEPQVGIDSFALTKAFLISPGDTVPSNITTGTIYDENIEWITGTQGGVSVTDFNNTDNPLHLTKDIFVSKYYNNAQLYFVNGAYVRTQNTPNSLIMLPIYLNGVLDGNIYISLTDSSTLATNVYRLGSNDNFNKNNLNNYQTVIIPTSNLTWINGRSAWTTLNVVFAGYDTSGAKGLYLDYIRLQSGIQNIPSSIDYSNKQDSNYVRNDSLFWVAKGIEHFITKVGTCDTCISTVNISADSTLLYFIRVNGDTARIVDFYGSGGGSYQLPYNGNATDYLGGDTAYHPLPITDTSHLSDRIDLKLNISDTASMLSPYQKAITLTTTGTSGAATLTGSTLNIPNYATGGGGVDSSAYHTIEVAEDSLFIICDLNGRCDTTVFNTSNIWAKNGNKIYYNAGNVGIGTTDPPSLLTLSKPTSSTTPDDSLGLSLQTSTDATSGNWSSSLPLIFGAKGWNTVAGESQDVKFKMYATSNSSSSTSGNLQIDNSLNGGAYSNKFIFQSNGAFIATNGVSGGGPVSGTFFTGSSFTATRNVNNGSSFTDNTSFIAPASPTTYRAFYYNPTWSTSSITGVDVRAFDNTIGDNVLNRVRGSTSIGTDSAVVGAKLAVTSTTSAFLLPRMTKVQRDSIYSGFTGSITNAGSGTRANTSLNVVLTGGSGNGAVARVTITSNVISDVQILTYGIGYAVGDVLTGVVTGITGWTWTISAITPPKAGSVIYQTDNTPGIRVFNGTNWMKFTETTD